MKRQPPMLSPADDDVVPFVMKFSVNLETQVGKQLKETAFQQRLSESSIVEVALKQLFGRISADVLGTFLRQNGATLRRRA